MLCVIMRVTSEVILMVTHNMHFDDEIESQCSVVLSMEKFYIQGSHRHEKYLNIQDCLEKSLKIKLASKSILRKTLQGLEKSLNFTIFRRVQHCL